MRALWLVAGLCACLVIVGLVTRGSQNEEPSPVLVAKQLIPAGTPGSSVAGMVALTTLPSSETEPGAIADKNYLVARVTTRDVFPGEQLTGEDFARP